MDRYVAEHAAKGRSAVVAKALKLLQRSEQESYLSLAYAQSAEQDQQIAAQFDATLNDGLRSNVKALETTHETW